MNEISVELYNPPDIDQAHAEWSATCAPAALAAVLRVPVMQVKPFFVDYRGWVNPTQMERALSLSAVKFQKIVYLPTSERARFADYGMVLIQFEGPWLNPGVPPRAAYRYMHWVASARRGRASLDMAIFDANADGWLMYEEWCEDVLPLLLANHKRATGWHVKAAWEVQP